MDALEPPRLAGGFGRGATNGSPRFEDDDLGLP